MGFLVLTALLAVNVDAQTTTTTTVTTTTNTTTSASFCELCRDKGNCAQAYKGAPGIFCGAWLNAASQRMACCCPANGQCAKTPSNYECMCQAGPTTKPPKSAAASNGVALVTTATVFAVVATVSI
jgi:hypothetical protein